MANPMQYILSQYPPELQQMLAEGGGDVSESVEQGKELGGTISGLWKQWRNRNMTSGSGMGSEWSSPGGSIRAIGGVGD